MKKKSDPIRMFHRYWRQAVRKKDPVTDAMALATVDGRGRPYVRTVLLKRLPGGEFGFVTRRGGKKNEQMRQHSHVECCFHWPTLYLQIRIRCRVARMSQKDMLWLWRRRPREAQIVYHLPFPQSSIIPSFLHLQQAFRKLKGQWVRPKTIPISPQYIGYQLHPYAIEFLSHRPNRLNERYLYRRHRNQWLCQTLSP